ncbi:hypothetical protein TcCL_ESM03559 [Trypanosoma cruzi]|uniref:Uncharacterized protein n=2 Tax=Trypanosoma cruzi TaxID=5693 RepID=Q4DE66_TRYCC|nr:hypothetical protein, conserved [Trypanosoma cruzi]EAN90817.1 hypothetical protein, conserved [Trypanosoma cruzi]RNC58826.1 hypothetical protein TcCL_ESM03559 [Trypanosoma cruzi]|eukprot:XP_812668.1 hypothetical protein [Trypanosoma cruzi strain CL Brener]
MYLRLQRLLTLSTEGRIFARGRSGFLSYPMNGRGLHLSGPRLSIGSGSGSFFAETGFEEEQLQQQWASDTVNTASEVSSDEMTRHTPTSGGEKGALNAQEVCGLTAASILREAVPLTSSEDIKDLLKGCKNAKELRHVLDTVLYRNPLCHDVLNGHGYRVAVLQALTAVAPRTQCLHEWFDCVDNFRRLGFVLTRTFAAEGFTVIREWLSHHFNYEGRSPLLVTEGISHIRELVQFCKEDRLVFDHVLYTRIVFLLTMIVGFFDRQNIYRSAFPENFTKRDGVVVEWVISCERCVDFDECVLQCDAVLEEVLEMLRQDIPSRPNFSIMYRLIDYYFATDNVEKMIAVMEDTESYGIDIAESSTAKLMQLACALNYPNVPELFMRWRVSLPQCVLATPDMSRLMFYYSRSGGGRPCPLCNEPYNHRNVSVYVWQKTPEHQRNCQALMDARRRKGELDENTTLPQNQDWSEMAFGLWQLSQSRAIEWGAVEWRGFLLCCMFSPRALEAKGLLDKFFDHTKMDDFLRATYVRLLRHHAPELVFSALSDWREKGQRLSPIVLQESLMGSVMINEATERQRAVKHIWKALLEKDSYVMPFTKRLLQRRLEELRARTTGGITSEETALFLEIIGMQPRHLSLLDMKDSTSDFVVGISKKNYYAPHTSSAGARIESGRQRRCA